jgi:hypothetical protein
MAEGAERHLDLTQPWSFFFVDRIEGWFAGLGCAMRPSSSQNCQYEAAYRCLTWRVVAAFALIAAAVAALLPQRVWPLDVVIA